MNFINQLFLHDARRLTEILPTNEPFISTTITSPPYWNLKDYGVKKQIGFGQSKAEYLSDVERVLSNCYLVTKSTGSLWIVVDDYRENGVLRLLPWEVAECAKRAGWILRDIIIWDKQHSVPWHMKGQMRNVLEFILFLTKTDDYKYDLDRIKVLDEISKWWVDFPERFSPKGKTPTNIWSIPLRAQGTWRRPSKIDHHCPFPTALVARILELTTDPGDIVLDPFAGSGVVLAQAAAMGRSFVGFEINRKYVKMFHKTVRGEIAAEWKQLLRWRERRAKANGSFEQTVMKLRALKYARQVTKPFLDKKRAAPSRFKAVLCLASIPKQYRRKHPLEVTVYVIVEEHSRRVSSALKKAVARTTEPPLSHYEIMPKIEVVTLASLKRKHHLVNSRFYLYPGYRPRKHVGASTLKEWLDGGDFSCGANGSKVPMLANIAVDVAWAFEE